jgi:ABC-type nickel/cobalt efflux system permease component RcnA
MTQLITLVLLGFFLGMRHATDPDHVIAVATIVARQRRLGVAAQIGALWGLGHMLTIGVVGMAIIVFRLTIPPRLGLGLEFAVALMLILLGASNLLGLSLRQILGLRRHAHVHAHGDYAHSHPHGAHGHGHAEDETPQAWLDRRMGGMGGYALLRPLLIGVVHGLAGSAAVALLVLASIPDPAWALAYLLLFGAGTIAGMVLITVLMAAPLLHWSHRTPRVAIGMRLASGLISMGFGLFLALHLVLVDGLFGANPNWIPG